MVWGSLLWDILGGGKGGDGLVKWEGYGGGRGVWEMSQYPWAFFVVRVSERLVDTF